MQRRRERQILARSGARSAFERPRQLERVERVPARALVDGVNQSGREGAPEPPAHHRGELALAKRADPDALGTERPDHGRRRARLDPAREEQAHRLGRQPAAREGEDRCARLVGPLDVVDRDEHRRGARELADRGQEGDGQHARVLQRVARGVVEQQRGAERAALWPREAGEPLEVDAREQVTDGRERQRALAVRRPRRQDAVTVRRQRRLPHRRLAAAGLALQHERRRRRTRDEPPHRRDLGLAADDLPRCQRHDVLPLPPSARRGSNILGGSDQPSPFARVAIGVE